MEQLSTFFLDNLNTPGFPMGVVSGGVLMYFGIARGTIPTPTITKLRVELAEVRTRLEETQKQLEQFQKEFEDFAEWRKDQVDKVLSKT